MGVDDGEEIPRFADREEELSFWRSRAQNLRSTLRDTEMTLKDFEESSRELEKEMESELNAANGKSRELLVRTEKLKGDVDEWKGKYQRALTDHNKMLAEVNRELSTLRDSHNVYRKKVQEMELDNDELENAERMVASSLIDMETRYNRAIERTALLEEELVAKTKLEEENQRLKDEIRELKEELNVWQDRHTASRSVTRASADRAASAASVGRGSLDLDRSSYRPSSRASHDRPSSRLGSVQSPATSSSSTATSTNALRRTVLPHRTSLAAHHARRDSADITRSDAAGGMSSSPTTANLRARQSIGVRPSTTSSAGTARSSRPTLGSSGVGGGRVQQGASMRKMAGLLQNLRELQATVHSATRIGPHDAQASAIPRPASRLSTSIGPSSTPRRSMDVRRDADLTFGATATASPPSSIPLPTNGLSRSTSQRPPSRLSMPASHQPSSVRSQTPNLEHYTSLDFLEQDPAQQTTQQMRRRSHLASLASSTTGSSASSRDGLSGVGPPSSRSTLSHSTSHSGALARPRGSTFSSNILRRGNANGVNGGAGGGGGGAEEALRKSINPHTGRPAPPPVSLRQSISTRHRSSSFGHS